MGYRRSLIHTLRSLIHTKRYLSHIPRVSYAISGSLIYTYISLLSPHMTVGTKPKSAFSCPKALFYGLFRLLGADFHRKMSLSGPNRRLPDKNISRVFFVVCSNISFDRIKTIAYAK